MLFFLFEVIKPFKKKEVKMLKKILFAAGTLGAAALGVKAVKNMYKMPLIGDRAPFFNAQTTHGELNFPCDYNGKWVILFSHPADFTPVCTSELMAFARYYDKFKEINTELVGLSVDNIESHKSWILSMKEKMGTDINFPIIDDKNGDIARKYGMLQNDTKTVRAVFVICPRGNIHAIIYYPQTVGRNIDEILRLTTALQVSKAFEVGVPVNWQEGDDVIVPPDKKAYQMSDEEKKEQNITCHDWYFCTKSLSKNEIDEKIKKM